MNPLPHKPDNPEQPHKVTIYWDRDGVPHFEYALNVRYRFDGEKATFWPWRGDHIA
jgi:hypothetical protein